MAVQEFQLIKPDAEIPLMGYGQLIAIKPEGFLWGVMDTVKFAILRVDLLPEDIETLLAGATPPELPQRFNFLDYVSAYEDNVLPGVTGVPRDVLKSNLEAMSRSGVSSSIADLSNVPPAEWSPYIKSNPCPPT